MTTFGATHEEVLIALTHAVRCLSLDQIEGLTGLGVGETGEVVRSLEGWGLVSVEPYLVSVAGTPVEPVILWRPGDLAPDFRAASYRLRSRWHAPHEMDVAFPTAEACRRYGGSRIRPRSNGELDHDLWMGHVYLRYRDRLQEDTGIEWTPGDALRAQGGGYRFSGRVPDACLVFPSGEVERIVEGGGKGYSRSKLQGIHDAYREVPYEIW